MEPVALVLGIVVVLIVLYVLFSGKKGMKDKKSYYLKRFLKNREQSLKHITEVEALATDYDAFDKKAFPDRDITFQEYIQKLRSNYENDYSNAFHQILKKNRLTYAQKQEYTKKLMEQSEDLYLMEVNMGILNKTWRKPQS